MNYSISKNSAIDALNLADDRGQIHSILDTIDIINTLPPTCHLLEDGTLIVKVPNLSAVHRVIVDGENSQYCKTFYQDCDEEDGKDGDGNTGGKGCTGGCRYGGCLLTLSTMPGRGETPSV